MSRVAGRLGWILVGLTLVAGLVLTGGPTGVAPATPVAPAADVNQFNPGNVIADAVFFDGDAWDANGVQTFLDVKGAGCRPGADGTPCLRAFRQDTTARAADAYCDGYVPGVQESAAQIIAKVATSCDVNPRVLMVMLQKEQGLVLGSGNGLYAMRYLKAMGFACPDTAACDSAYFGFQNQVYSAARQFQRYAASPTSFGYRAGRTSNVLFHPNAACGSSPVYIQNQATAGLYVYTPYQPNTAALVAGYGAGSDPCSSFGNRNFWLYYTDWFGSTQLAGQSALAPLGAVDSAVAVTGNQVRVQGWALDPDTAAPIQVHAYVDGAYAGAFTAGVSRPDLATTFPTLGAAHGYDLGVTVQPGTRSVCVFAINVGAPSDNPQVGCRTVDTRSFPFGSVDATAVVGNTVRVSGWAVDLDTSATPVHVYVNGGIPVVASATTGRPDVGAVYRDAGNSRGFDVTAPLQPGDNQVCVYAINVPTAGDNPLLGCRTVTLVVDPIGSLDYAGAGDRSVVLSGWALDPETPASLDVHVYVDGAYAGAFPAANSRPDVAAAHPASGDRHGYSVTVPVSPGVRTVCVFAINRGFGDVNPQIGCRTVNVGVSPLGRFDSVVVDGFSARIAGWALDPDTTAPVDVRISVDGTVVSTVAAKGDRPDIATAFPGLGAAHGLETTVPLTAGAHTICGTAVNTVGGMADTRISCASVTVWPSGQREPIGQLDGVGQSGGVTTVSGWALDPDAPTVSVPVHFYLDGRYANSLPADLLRSDVGAYYRGAGDAHGYAGYFILSSGRHTVCVYGINRGPGALNPQLGCRVVTVP